MTFFKKSFRERIKTIVDTSYNILCNKIVCGDIRIYNEASMQLHLGTIIKQLGELYEFSDAENFRIELEAPEEISPTQKSSSGYARCDIKLLLSNGNEICEALIELKYLKKSTNEAVTDNKYSVYCDIENLESYKKKDNNRLCFEIIYTDNINYTHKNNYKFCIGNGHLLSAGSYQYTQNRTTKIEGNYSIEWDICDQQEEHGIHCFLKIDI